MEDKRNIFDVFLDGERKALKVAAMGMIPNICMAFAIIKVLNLTGFLKIIGVLFGPLMGVFGLPGEAITGLILGWLAMAGGVGAMIGLLQIGVLTPVHITILFPAIQLMGAQLQFSGRFLGNAGLDKKYWPALFTISIICAFSALFVMKILVGIMYKGA